MICSVNSDAFMVLQDVVISKTVLNDLKHLRQFSHTGTLEIYHRLYNRWAPKSQLFSSLGMVMRGQLAVLDFDSDSGLEQARTKSEEEKSTMLVFRKLQGRGHQSQLRRRKIIPS